ncbi:hypothetical protein HPB52_006775 [Rhipicephalus sanguineus]|uniref:Uncharacterized protein n=1 Tax=Rhipicephalus sanguineus TaxID=34632 RepID=A0A9D4QI47_RHISA|nr:hypothetical protein HPB52_006775 [Rhipicephalus sanguineus]
MESLPLENVRAQKRHRLRRRLMPSPVRQSSQVATGSGGLPPWEHKDNLRRRSTRKTLPCCPGGNIERDARPPSRRFPEATAIQTAPRSGGRCVLGKKIVPVGCRHAAHRIPLLQPVARMCLSEQPAEVPRDIGIRRATTAGGESSLLDWPSDTTFGTIYSADSGLLPAGSKMATFSGKQARRAGATAVHRARHEAEKQEQHDHNI